MRGRGLAPPVQIRILADGRVRVKGNFDKHPFRMVHCHEKSGLKWNDAPAVLMLRKAK